MGGEQCGDCSTCIATELCVNFFRFPILITDDEVHSALAQAHPDTVDATFNTHW